MARPREFEIDSAVEAAMNIFWKHGYAGTSLPDLLAGMGIARGSLYKAFGSKKALFLKALDLYDRKYVQPAAAILNDPAITGEERITRVLRSPIKSVDQGDRRGCLLCNTAAGTSSQDDEITTVVNKQLNTMTQAFAVALADTQAHSVSSKDELAAEATSLTLTYVGLRVMARSGHSSSVLNSGAGQTLAKLNGSITNPA